MDDSQNDKDQQQEKINKLWQDYWDDRSDLLRNALCEYYLPLLNKQVDRIQHGLPRELDRGEIYSMGAMGLMKAVVRFDPAEKTRFETYGGRMIEYAIREGLRGMDHLKRQQRDRASRYDVAQQRFYTEHGRAPTDREIQQILGITDIEVTRYRKASSSTRKVSLEQPVSMRDSGRDLTERDMLQDQGMVGADEQVQKREFLQKMMEGLNPEERLVVELYDLRGLTMRQAGIVIGISESRVSQLRVSVIKRLRSRFAGQLA